MSCDTDLRSDARYSWPTRLAEEPVSILVNTYRTGKVPAGYIVKWIRKTYDLTPAGMIHFLGLQHVDYTYTSTLGHFWRQWLPWEDESTPYENKNGSKR